jgi:hypothetical protein
MKTMAQLKLENRILRAEIRLLKLAMNQLNQEQRLNLLMESVSQLVAGRKIKVSIRRRYITHKPFSI